MGASFSTISPRPTNFSAKDPKALVHAAKDFHTNIDNVKETFLLAASFFIFHSRKGKIQAFEYSNGIYAVAGGCFLEAVSTALRTSKCSF